jgi:hypothetical protein
MGLLTRSATLGRIPGEAVAGQRPRQLRRQREYTPHHHTPLAPDLRRMPPRLSHYLHRPRVDAPAAWVFVASRHLHCRLAGVPACCYQALGARRPPAAGGGQRARVPLVQRRQLISMPSSTGKVTL